MSESSRNFQWWYRHRGLLVLPAAAVAALCRWRETEWDALVFPLGGSLFGLGLALRVWAQMHLHYRLKVRKALTTTGPYAHVRNPIYLGNIMIMVGLCAMCELLWLCPLIAVYGFAVYSLVVRYEESHLRSKYGERYLDYASRTPRWIPVVRLSPGRERGLTRTFLWASVVSEVHLLMVLALPLLKEAL